MEPEIENLMFLPETFRENDSFIAETPSSNSNFSISLVYFTDSLDKDLASVRVGFPTIFALKIKPEILSNQTINNIFDNDNSTSFHFEVSNPSENGEFYRWITFNTYQNIEYIKILVEYQNLTRDDFYIQIFQQFGEDRSKTQKSCKFRSKTLTLAGNLYMFQCHRRYQLTTYHLSFRYGTKESIFLKIFEIFLIQNKELRRSSRHFGELLVPVLAGVLGYETAQTFQNKPSESKNKK